MKNALLLFAAIFLHGNIIPQSVNRDTRGSKDYVNVFYDPQYTLFDLWSDEPIFPDANGVYNIYYATNENKIPKQYSGRGSDLSSLTVYKFKNYKNCRNWCDGIEYRGSSNVSKSINSSPQNSSNVNSNGGAVKDITWLKGKTFVFRGPSTTYLQFRDTYANYVGNYTLKTSFGTSDCPFEFEMNKYVQYGIIVTINCEDESPYRLELEIDQKTGSLKSKNYQGGKQVIYTLTN
jgi:hypothetical protein